MASTSPRSFVRALLATTVAALAGASALASTVTYTSRSDFLAAVQPGAYTETFDSGTVSVATTDDFSANAFSYTVSASPQSASGEDVYRSGSSIGNFQSETSLVFSFTSANVTALGGNFFLTDADDNFVAAPLTITLADGTTSTFAPQSAGDYLGFTSTTPIASLVFAAPGADHFNSVDNFTVGVASPDAPTAAVPEPSTAVLMAGSLALLAGVGRLTRERLRV